MPIGPTKTKAQKQNVVHQEMHEFKHGELHSGSKKGPKVTSRKQAVAIALSEAGLSKKGNPHAKQHEQTKSHRNPGFYDDSAHAGLEGDCHHCEGESFRLGAARANVAVEKAHENLSDGRGMQPAQRRWEHPDWPNERSQGSHRAHGYGHGVSRRDGALRLSGHSGAHQIGKKR